MLFGFTFVQFLILVVIVAACVALTRVALRKFGIQIPDWVVEVFWIVVVALAVIFALKLVAGLF